MRKLTRTFLARPQTLPAFFRHMNETKRFKNMHGDIALPEREEEKGRKRGGKDESREKKNSLTKITLPYGDVDEPGAQPFSYLHTFFCEELLCRIMEDGQAVEASLLVTLEETSHYNPSPFQNTIGPLTIGPGCLHLPQLQKLNISFSLFHNQSFTFTPDLMVDLRIFSW